MNTSDMAYEAAVKALENAKIKAEEIGFDFSCNGYT